LYPNDHLREAREIGAQVPIIYDFVYSYLKANNKVYDVSKKGMVDFNFAHAQKLFKTYVFLALDHGIINCNWPFLEALSMVGNILAIDSAKERDRLLQYFLTENLPRQDALKKAAQHFLDNQGHWPESFNYSIHVAKNLTYLMALVTKYKPSLKLGEKYPYILSELGTDYNYTFPNKTETVIFGDGHRDYHPNYIGYEFGYFLAELDGLETVKNKIGPRLYSAQEKGDYNRFELKERNYPAAAYLDPLTLLWFVPELKKELQEYPLPVTDELYYAGLQLQRNLSSTNNPQDALMAVVSGGSHVHGHASGMKMELYGKGYVLGGKSGRSRYKSEIHENYYRIFASNNTVIVNGASEGAGGWANLVTNRVQKVAMEPAVKKIPLSKNYSFTTSSFIDDKGDAAQAKQQRTLGVIRTSPTTGYYIDVFRSKSELENEYHDYIYHNIGDKLDIYGSTGEALKLKSDSKRYKNSLYKEWKQNRTYKNPGWHYFENVKSSKEYTAPVSAIFTASLLEEEPVYMKLYTNKNQKREYTTVIAPESTEGPKAYRKKKTPTLVIRQKGAAWDTPFATIYEPYMGNGATIISVEEIIKDTVFKGFEVVSEVDSKKIKQYVLVQENEDDVFEDKNRNVYFKGRYAVVTLDEKDALTSVYIGQGQELKTNGVAFISENQHSLGAFIELNETLTIKATHNLIVKRKKQKDVCYRVIE